MNYEEYMDRIQERYGTPYIQIPNRLIKDLTHLLREEKSESYVHYAYSFIVINAFLYKYTHYIDFENDDYLNTADMKRMLKYNPNSQKINRISKKGGILDEGGFIEVSTDIPLSISWEYSKQKDWSFRKITTLSESDAYIKRIVYESILRTRKYYCYIPEFMIDYKDKAGTLNNYKNTFRITYPELKKFVFDEDMSLRDFLLYSYIKSTRNKNGSSDLSYDTIKRQTGISHSTAKKIIDNLETQEIISVKENKNVSRFQGKPKTYRIRKKFIKEVNTKKKGKLPKRKAFWVLFPKTISI